MSVRTDGGVEQRGDDQYPPDWEERRREVLQRDDFRCQLCGRRGGPYAEDEAVHLHAHHTVPPSEGGSNDVDNLITLCDLCYEHHHGQPRSADPGSGPWLSVGTLVATWGALLGMTVAALEVASVLVGDPVLGVEPVGALLAGVVLFAVSVRLCSAPEWGPVFGTGGAILTWIIPLRTGGDLWLLTDVIQSPLAFGAAVLFTLVPYAVAQHISFASGGEDASVSAHGV